MVSLIPGLSESLAYWRPKDQASSQESFAQVLASVAAAPDAAPPPPPTYVVQAGDNLFNIAKKLGVSDPYALARANKLKDPNLLKVGQVLTLPPEGPAPTQTQPGRQDLPLLAALDQKSKIPSRSQPTTVVASWYGPRHHGRLMANGEPYDMFAHTAAHPNLPFGTRLRLTNPQTGRSVTVEVTDRGPYIQGRSLDVSFGAASKLGMVKAGVVRLYLEKSKPLG